VSVQTTTGPAVRRSAAPAPGVDRALAGRLIADGRVSLPESPAWEAELLALMATAQRRLRFTSSVFLMGENHVALFLVTRDDLAAVAPDQVLAEENAVPKHRKPRGERPAVRPISDRTDAWTLPAVNISPAQQHSSELLAVYTEADPVAVSEQVEPLVDDPTEEYAAVEDVVDDEPGPAAHPTPNRRRVVAIGAAAAGVLIVGGLLGVVVVDRNSTPAPQASAPPTSVVPVTTNVPAIDRAALKDIAKPVELYVTPKNTAAPQPANNRSAPRPKPRGRFLPNPIPGLPPIPLP